MQSSQFALEGSVGAPQIPPVSPQRRDRRVSFCLDDAQHEQAWDFLKRDELNPAEFEIVLTKKAVRLAWGG